MDFEFDISSIVLFLNQPSEVVLFKLFIWFGWIPFAIVFLYGAKEMWIYYIQDKWSAGLKYTLLAIDIPRSNRQSPKAVEAIFTYLGGAHGTQNLIEKYWIGVYQQWFSLEIVSIDGYTQFLIRTPSHFRNLVESAVYSQYPDAEITEVNDYTENSPEKFPDDEYDLWGAEFIQTAAPGYPIKVYDEFLHNFGAPEEQFKDPMATLMDLNSTLKPGEQIWYQILIQPRLFGWLKPAENEVKKILKEPTTKPSFIFNVINGIIKFIESLWGTPSESASKEPDALKMMNLKPKEKKQVEGIHHKMSKWAFNTKIRFVYLAKKEVMNKPKAVSGFVGFIKQFAALDLNGFKPDMSVTATSVSYLFKNYRLSSRQTKIIKNYKKRSLGAGRNPGLLNTEELATIWHFPIEAVVKAPLIQKAPGRKAEPPMTLPILSQEREADAKKGAVENFGLEAEAEIPAKESSEEKPKAKGLPPENLPFA